MRLVYGTVLSLAARAMIPLRMRVRFWGVRGSVPWATADSIGHGCNTPCVEVRDERTGALLVLDAGSGIVGLGQALGGPPRPVPILLTHYHWDHTQGLPFFAPFFQPGWTPSIWAPTLDGRVARVGRDDLRLAVLSRCRSIICRAGRR